jgi:glycolate oxidase iron-sulfur subunit
VTTSGYDACVRCGLCLPTCPTYLETLTETSGPRGRIALIKAVDQGDLDLLSPQFVHQMSECLDCRACEAACPSGVPYGALLEDMRSRIEQAVEPHRSPAAQALRRTIVDWLFARLSRVRVAARLLRIAQRTGLIRLGSATTFSDAIALAPVIPDHFFVPEDQRFAVSRAAGTAMLHAGCVMHVAFPHVHEATVRMLNRAGLTVVVPRAQGCCGAIAVHAGETAVARELAKANISAFESSGADVYIVNAAGCGAALKEYGTWFADDPAWRSRATACASRVRDISEVLDAMNLPPAPKRLDMRATYQEPCHLVHAQRVSAAPRRLLEKIPGLRVIEMNESAVCCGSAGIYNLTQPHMAERLQRRKIDNIERTRADVVVTANPGCAMQVTAGLRERRSAVRVVHLVELLDEAYASDEAETLR